jgi:NIPSNAP protein
MFKQSRVIAAAGLVLGAILQCAYAADAPTPARVFEIRTYHCLPGRLEALHKRFREHTMKIFEKHGMTNVAYWTFEDSPAKESTLIYVISHASREQAKKNWDEFRNDPQWKAVAAASEADGKIVEKVDSVFVDATDYSPLK